MSSLERDPLFEAIGVCRSKGQELCHENALADFPSVDAIVHLAGSVGVPESWKQPETIYQNNLLSTLTVLKFARKQPTPLIFLSSYVYGLPAYLPIDEKHPVNCSNPYAQSKYLAECLCEAYHRDFDVPLVILRPFNIYGPGQRMMDLISQVAQQAKKGNPIEVNDLAPKRDYLHVSDLVHAILQLLRTDRQPCGVYNLGTGRSHSVQDMIDIVLKVAKKRVPVVCRNRIRKNEIMDCRCDCRKFMTQFDWKPRVSLQTGIRMLLRTIRVQ